MVLSDYLLIALIIFILLLYPLLRKVAGLLEILVSKYSQKTTVSPTPETSTAKTLLNLKLLAYERIILFVERMKPDSLIPRTVGTVASVREFQLLLINEVRNEYEYNLSQQLYLSETTWNIATSFKDNIITLINSAATECEAGKPATDLAKKILENYISSDFKADQILKLIKADLKNK